MIELKLFLQRHEVLYNFYIGGLWEIISPELLRQRPDPRLNSIAWNLWHIARVEDATLNRFIADRPQVLDEEGWLAHLNLPWRHHGNAMTSSEVDELNRRVDLAALQGYGQAVGRRTHAIVNQLDPASLDDLLTPERVRLVLIDEGVAHPQAAGLIENYSGLSKGRMLFNHGLTHSFQHVGEMDVIASLLGVEL
jgi:DinB superfamily